MPEPDKYLCVEISMGLGYKPWGPLMTNGSSSTFPAESIRTLPPRLSKINGGESSPLFRVYVSDYDGVSDKESTGVTKSVQMLLEDRSFSALLRLEKDDTVVAHCLDRSMSYPN